MHIDCSWNLNVKNTNLSLSRNNEALRLLFLSIIKLFSMNKIELASFLNEFLIPIGFKKKGNYWVINGDEITKMVNLQQSQFSERFYINYGYILKSIPLDDMMHIYNRVASIDNNENKRIDELLDLEYNISDKERESELKDILHEKLVRRIQSVNTEEDLLNELKSRPQLNDISLVVKKHFNLIE